MVRRNASTEHVAPAVSEPGELRSGNTVVHLFCPNVPRGTYRHDG